MLDIAIVQALITALLGAFPGIPAGIAAFLSSMTAQLPALVASGTDVVGFVQDQLSVVRGMIAENRDPTPQEWGALNGTMRTELAKLNIQGMHPLAPGMA